MKYLYILFTIGLVLFQIEFSSAQANENSEKKEQPLIVAEQMPQYKGGDKELGNFLSGNLKYPENSLQNNISGVVWIQFTVNKNGKLSDFIILKSPANDLGEEAIRALKLMPNWAPGIQNGRKVSVFVKMPIKFTLTDDKKDKDSK
jgi:periplasmic protein TonB